MKYPKPPKILVNCPGCNLKIMITTKRIDGKIQLIAVKIDDKTSVKEERI
jgi:hypothetical protein